MGVFNKLSEVQRELKAPKRQWNSFSKFNYRSCEDILEAVKPILYKNKALIILSDTVRTEGDWHYITATASFVDVETGEKVEVTGQAHEGVHKGMCEDQCTGTASSYARKYALNGLLCIDDTKDEDTDEFKRATSKPAQVIQKAQSASIPVEVEQEYTCTKCGKKINGAKKKDGTVFTPAQIYEQTNGLCLVCATSKE